MTNFNGSILSFVLLLIANIVAFFSIASAEAIKTKHFQIYITRHCVEYDIVCNDVTYVGKDLRTGKSIRLTGRTLNSSRNYDFAGMSSAMDHIFTR